MLHWLSSKPLILASTSPTRRQILVQCGLDPAVVAPAVDERALEATLETPSPRLVATVLACAKALDGAKLRPGHVVLGADQTLSCEGRAFHKPADTEEAVEQILALSGRRHTLHTAAALVKDTELLAEILDEAHLTMRPLRRAEAEAYVAAAGRGATSSVGAYQIEGLGIHLFEDIEGAHTTILGLPVLPLLHHLRRLTLIG